MLNFILTADNKILKMPKLYLKIYELIIDKKINIFLKAQKKFAWTLFVDVSVFFHKKPSSKNRCLIIFQLPPPRGKSGKPLENIFSWKWWKAE